MSVVSAVLFRMMQASEEALLDATCARVENERRIALGIVGDADLYRLWKAEMQQHLATPAAAKSLAVKIRELRRVGTGLEHQRALIDHLRRSSITGEHRERLLARYFRGLDYETAVVREHRRFKLAVAGEIALDRLLLIHHDEAGRGLLLDYRARYARYFALYCDWMALHGAYADIVGAAMLEARREADEWRRLTLTVRLPQARKRRFGLRGRRTLPAPDGAQRAPRRDVRH